MKSSLMHTILLRTYLLAECADSCVGSIEIYNQERKNTAQIAFISKGGERSAEAPDVEKDIGEGGVSEAADNRAESRTTDRIVADHAQGRGESRGVAWRETRLHSKIVQGMTSWEMGGSRGSARHRRPGWE
eukprot:IDg9345t1